MTQDALILTYFKLFGKAFTDILTPKVVI